MSEYTPITRKPRGRSRSKDRRPLYSGGGELSQAAKKERALAQLDAEVEKVKAGTFLQAPVTAGGAIIDALSRSEYAMAGAGEVLAEGGSLADAGRRMANEILSGLGPFKGEKRGATEVLEREGVPEGMHLSDTWPNMLAYSDTGEGIRLQRGGYLDPSARSGLGLGLSIVGDPLTYVGGVGVLRKIGEKTLSTKGGKALTKAFVDATSDASTRAAAISTMKAADPALTSMAANAAMKRGQGAAPVLRDLAKAKAERDVLAAAAADPSLLDKGGIHFVTGHTIPGTQVLNPVFNAARQSYRKMANAWEGMGSLFFVGHKGRKFKDFQKDLTAVKPAISDGVAKWETEISTAAKGFNLDDAAKKRVAIAVDEGKIGTLQGKEQAAATWIAQKKKQLLQAEWDAGIRVPAREHYLAHYYLNTPEELDRIKVRWGHKYGTAGDLGRHLEERSFDTYADAVRATTFQNSIDGTTPILKPLYDPFESLRRRSRKSVEARTWRAFEEIVATKHGRPPWVDGQTVNDLFDLSQRPTRVLNQGDASTVNRLLNTPSVQSGSAVTMEKIVRRPEVRLARENLDRVLKSAPVKEMQVETLRGLDEIKYYERRGWEVVQQPPEGRIGLVNTTDYKRARAQYEKAIGNPPLKYVDKVVLKHADESAYFRRRGYDIVEEDGKLVAYGAKDPSAKEYSAWKEGLDRARAELEKAEGEARTVGITATAYKPKDVGNAEYTRWNTSLKKARKLLDAVENRARRNVVVRTGAVRYDKIADVNRLSDNGKRAFFEDRIAKVKSREELFSVMEKYEQFKSFFPKQKRVLGELAPDGSDYVTISLKGLGDRDLPRPLADEIAALGKGLIEGKTPEGAALRKYILEPYDWIQNTFKLGAVAFPSFHTRNWYSNPAQSFAEIGVGLFNPRRRRDTAALLWGSDGIVKTKMGNYSLAELRPIFEKRGVIAPGANLFEYSEAIQPNQSWFTNKTKVRKAIENVQSKVGGTIENEARVMHALTILERTGSVDEAVASVNKFLFDYSNMTEFERTYMKRLFPFWTWTSKNFMRQIENLRLRPGKLANEIKPVRGRSEEDEKLTTFEDGALKFRLDNDGKTLRVISGVDLPIRNMDLLYRGSLEKTGLGLIGMMSPLPKAVMEQSFGINAFTGRPMGRVKSEGLAGMLVQKLPKSMQLWLGYQDKHDAAGRPIMEFDERRFNLLFKAWATSRLVSTSDRMFREYINAFENDNNKAAVSATIDVLTGLRVKELNMTEQWQRRVNDRIRQSEDALIRMGERREGRYLYKPKPKK